MKSAIEKILLMDKALFWNLLNKVKRILFGKQLNDGFIVKTFVYALLISIGFIYVYPIIFMISQSFKSLKDLLDPTVLWLPKELYLDNYIQAWNTLDFPKAFAASVFNSTIPAVAQTLSCAMVGYGFARFTFPGKNIMFVLMIMTFIVPVQVVMIPLFLLFENYGMLGTPLPFIIPAMLAGGIKSALFILIYTQFFRTIPKALEESAQMDGAGYFKTFIRIILPISAPAIVVVFLFSFVWHWNETYTASLYLQDSLSTLPMKLQSFEQSFAQMYSSSAGDSETVDINESIKMAGTMLIILPLLVLYLFAQRWFVEVADKTGITGE